MPKDTGKDCGGVRHTATTQGELKNLATHLIVDSRGVDAREIEITFATADNKDECKRAEMIEKVLKQTPNLTKLKLDFSGWLYKPSDCLGDKLLETMCKLTKLEHFESHQTAGTRTDFGLYALRKLVSSWPNLRTIYLAGDTNGSRDCSQIPPVTCALESVTFERCMAEYEKLAPMFAGSANSLKKLEMWVLGHGELDHILRHVIPAIEEITLGGYEYVSSPFLRDELSKAPHLHTLSFRGDFSDSDARLALGEALLKSENYRALKQLGYPAQRPRIRRNVQGNKPAKRAPGEEELLKACRARNISAYIAPVLKYEVEGAQKRAGFAAMARRGW